MRPRGLLGDRVRGLVSRLAAPASAPTATATTLPPEQGLFVIGAARSGTTVLQNALNHSPDIFLLGEPELHFDLGEPGFAAHYNAMHRGWSNQETKSSFLPPVTAEDGPLETHLARLGELYRWVGSKIVVNARRDPSWDERMFAYHCRRFFQARYLFTFRDPLAVVGSTRSLQHATGTETDSARALIANYAEVVELYVRMLRNLPHVRAVFHNDMGAATFAGLGDWLGVSLTGAEAYYDSARVQAYSTAGLDEDETRLLDALQALYADLRALAAEGGARLPQLEQNDAVPKPGHYTPLGSIARRARFLREAARG
jgi:hypothetical protein